MNNNLWYKIVKFSVIETAITMFMLGQTRDIVTRHPGTRVGRLS